MSDVKKIATRDSYGAALVELAKDHPDVVVLDADLAAATKTGVFKKAYPDRHFDCGIAESNMMAAAAGMAAMGLDALVEIGPGKALSGFVKKTVPELPVYAVETAAELEQLTETLKGTSL